jgi:hypothetical protein
MASAVAAYDKRNLKQSRLVELVAVDLVGGQGPVPEASEHERIGRLALKRVGFGHGEIADC